MSGMLVGQYLTDAKGQYQYQYQYLKTQIFNTNTWKIGIFNTNTNTSIPIPGIGHVWDRVSTYIISFIVLLFINAYRAAFLTIPCLNRANLGVIGRIILINTRNKASLK